MSCQTICAGLVSALWDQFWRVGDPGQGKAAVRVMSFMCLPSPSGEWMKKTRKAVGDQDSTGAHEDEIGQVSWNPVVQVQWRFVLL